MKEHNQTLSSVIVNNTKWWAIAQFFTAILQTILWIIIARRLNAQDIGALGLTLVFFNLAMMANELGLMSAIIQKSDINQKHLAGSFWIFLILGSVIAAITANIAPIAAHFYRTPQLTLLISIFSIRIIIEAAGATNDALMHKKQRFKALAAIEIISSTIFAITTIVLLIKNTEVSALAWGYFAKSAIKTILSTLWEPISIYPIMSFTGFHELFSFGRNILGVKIASYMEGNIDILLIGKYLGTNALGHYSLAMQIVNVPRNKISRLICQVAFPAFSSIQKNIHLLNKGYLKIIRYASAINIPIFAGILAMSNEFILTVYGTKWLTLNGPLCALAIYGAVFSITGFSGIIFNATGKPHYSFVFSVVSLIIMLTAIFIGIKTNIIYLCAALSVYAVIANIISTIMVKNILKYSYLEYITAITPSILSSVIMFIIIRVFLNIFHYSDRSSIAVFFATIALAALAYSLALFFISRRTFNELLGIMMKML